MRSTLASLLVVVAIAPPVIHEPFTALPCPLHPDTTIDVIGCQEYRVLRTDRAINSQVKTIFGLLRTDGARSAFVAGERSWLQYRRQSCSAEASRFAGGSAHAVALLSCDLRRNTTHIADLTELRKALAQR
jgi:uncharacterized protein YecT (DUF1311 family)